MPSKDKKLNRERTAKWRADHPGRNATTSARWRREYPDRHKRSVRKHSLKSRYGLTIEKFDSLLFVQGGVCAICKKPMQRICVDHDHETGAVRGLVHQKCNVGIGMLGDDPVTLRMAAEYLEKTHAAH